MVISPNRRHLDELAKERQRAAARGAVTAPVQDPAEGADGADAPAPDEG
jgi:hypothetical protein